MIVSRQFSKLLLGVSEFMSSLLITWTYNIEWISLTRLYCTTHLCYMWHFKLMMLSAYLFEIIYYSSSFSIHCKRNDEYLIPLKSMEEPLQIWWCCWVNNALTSTWPRSYNGNGIDTILFSTGPLTVKRGGWVFDVIITSFNLNASIMRFWWPWFKISHVPGMKVVIVRYDLWSITIS